MPILSDLSHLKYNSALYALLTNLVLNTQIHTVFFLFSVKEDQNPKKQNENSNIQDENTNKQDENPNKQDENPNKQDENPNSPSLLNPFPTI